MSADELGSLGRHPLVSIGGHTTTHAALSTLPAEDVRREMADNKAFLERLLDKDVKHFAYPYGDARACGAREFEIAREVGFTSATTVAASPIFPPHRDRLHSLPRVAVRPDETPESLYYRASGISLALNPRRRRQLAGASTI